MIFAWNSIQGAFIFLIAEGLFIASLFTAKFGLFMNYKYRGIVIQTITQISFLSQLIFLISCLFLHWLISLTNPGFIPDEVKVPRVGEFNGRYDTFCDKCKNHWKPERAYHCRVCNRCVFKMDHHCLWVNNCVGAKNTKFFVQFLISTQIYLSIFMANIVIAFFLILRDRSYIKFTERHGVDLDINDLKDSNCPSSNRRNSKRPPSLLQQDNVRRYFQQCQQKLDSSRIREEYLRNLGKDIARWIVSNRDVFQIYQFLQYHGVKFLRTDTTNQPYQDSQLPGAYIPIHRLKSRELEQVQKYNLNWNPFSPKTRQRSRKSKDETSQCI